MDSKQVTVRGEGLDIEDLVAVARYGTPVVLTDDDAVWQRVEGSVQFIRQLAESGEPVYGVTSGFGGMANVVIPADQADLLQNNLILYMTTGAGGYLPRADVRAAMLLRANSHLKGVSGIRAEFIRRMERFLNENVTPRVRDLGSIGASGDLVPSCSIIGSLAGLDEHYEVEFGDEVIDSISALKRLGLEPLPLKAKEGLAMINGTSVMTGVAAGCVYDTRRLLALSMATHAMFIQALSGTNQSFHPFLHEMKAHPGQLWSASTMLELLDGSGMSRDELDGSHDYQGDQPIQDRYSLRCLPQYTGPIVDGISQIAAQVTVEMNCANDNPLIDAEGGVSYHGGNFLGQYIGVSMDQLRYYLGLLIKHLDGQIALLVAPEFNNGLSASLVGNPAEPVNMGLKGLQITGNSILPLIGHLGNSIVDRFPTHAEQFNQNINSQGFNSANLARRSVDTSQWYLAVALLFGVQSVDLRTFQRAGHYDARELLSPATKKLYEAVMAALGREPSADKPLIYNDRDQIIESYVDKVAAGIREEGPILEAVEPVVETLR